MSSDKEPREHVTDEALAARIDARIGVEAPVGDGAEAPYEAAAGTDAHLRGCAECRARAREIERIVAALGAEPAMPGAAELAARRARVMEAIAARRPEPVGALRRRAAWWAPALAAAAVAALLLARAGANRGPAPNGSGAEVAWESLPVVAAAYDAAQETVTALQAAPEVTETDEVSTGVEMDVPLLDEFAALPAEDQEAILSELAAWRLEL